MDAQKYFGTTNLYKILEVDQNSQISEGTYTDIDIVIAITVLKNHHTNFL